MLYKQKMNSQTYLTNPTMWLNFYRNMANNKFNPYKYRKKQNQIGRGLDGRMRGSYIIPVNSNARDTDSSEVQTSLVTPVAAAEKRAASEHKEQQENNIPHVKIMKKSIKKRKSKKSIIKKKNCETISTEK